MAKKRRRKSRRSSARKSRASRSRRRRSNPGRRSHGRKRSHRRHRRNPIAAAAASFSPMKSLKSVAGAIPALAVGYFGVNAVQILVKRLFLDRVLASQSPQIQAAADLGARILIGVPAVTLIGGKVLRGKGGLIAAGAGANVVVNLGRAIVANVPGIPGVASDLLGDWPGTPGVYGFMTPGKYPALADFGAPGGTPNALPNFAAGGRGMF